MAFDSLKVLASTYSIIMIMVQAVSDLAESLTVQKMSKHYLQVQIATYLSQHAAKFMEQYQQAYETMIGQCSLKDVDDHDQSGFNCPMHPHFKA